MKTSLGLGQYRDLLLAILLFIVLDLGILFFNFFASIQLERDASRINTAGELRMLTQQITKSLLTLQIETRDGLLVQTSMAQLGQGTAAFNQGLATLKASMASGSEFRAFGLDPEELRGMLRRLGPALGLQQIARLGQRIGREQLDTPGILACQVLVHRHEIHAA